MTINPRIRTALAGLAIASATVATSMAQTTVSVPAARETPAVLRQAEREMAELVGDYWQAKLNGYRNTIDAMLPASDLAELNKLRVQWGIMMAPAADISQSTSKTARPSTLGADTLGRNTSVSITIMGSTSVDVDEVDDYMDDNPEAALQFVAAFQQVKAISTRNGSGFDRLGDAVLADVEEFITLARYRFTTFIEEHRAELQQSDEGRKLIEGRGKVDEVFAMLKSEENRTMMKMLYGNAIEPLVMLYNGVGVGDFFRQAGPVASVMPGWALEGSSVLKSCAPNPASTSATISYLLPEPSSRTRLRLFNAQGEEVANYDLGERPAGEGVATVNVGSLPAGTYLYHLTTTTGKGDAVFSKTMRVVR